MSGSGNQPDRKGKGRAYFDENGDEISAEYAALKPAERAQLDRARANNGVDTLTPPGPGPGSGSGSRGSGNNTAMTGTDAVSGPGSGSGRPGGDTAMTGTDDLFRGVPDFMGQAIGGFYGRVPALDPQTTNYLPNQATPGPSVPYPAFQAANVNDRPPNNIPPNAQPPAPTSFLSSAPAGLPAPLQPGQPLVAPRNSNGKSDRRALNQDPSMWFNQPAQHRTNPTTDCCWHCRERRKSCDIESKGYPCTRCQSTGYVCRNGLPGTKWEADEIRRQEAVARGEVGLPATGGRGRGRPGRDDRPARPRSASPERGRGNAGGGSSNSGPPAPGGSYVATQTFGPGAPPISSLSDVGMSAQGGGSSSAQGQGAGRGKSSTLPGRPFPSSSRAERRERAPRSRTRSPGRDQPPRNDNSDSGNSDAEDDSDYIDDNGGEGSSRNPPKPIPKRARTFKEPAKKDNGKRDYSTKNNPKDRVPIKDTMSDREYERRFGHPKKCHDCKNSRVNCTGGKPCDQCRKGGRVCVDYDLNPFYGPMPYTIGPPLAEHPSVRNSNVVLDPVTGNGGLTTAAARAARAAADALSMPPPARRPAANTGRTTGRVPVQRQLRVQARAQEQEDDDEEEGNYEENSLDIFNGLTNPYHHLRRDMEELGFGVPEASRGPLAVPIPPDWHTDREVRMFDAQYPYRYLEPNADLRRGYGFTGTAESANRPAWEEHAASRNWYLPPIVGTEAAPDPSLVRPDPELYMVDLQNPAPLPVFGQNIQAQDDVLNAIIPAPGLLSRGYRSRVPWISTWNFDPERTEGIGLNAQTETRGPLGWPYPMIDSMMPNHTLAGGPIYSDPVPCCENENAFYSGQNPKLCRVEPAMKCGVVGRYDCEHEDNPWHTCHICRNKQANFWHPVQEETLRRQKLYLCKDCAYDVRAESRSWERECLCYASKTCTNLCHLHREEVERAALEPLAIAEDFLIRQGILSRDQDKCIMCNIQDADTESNVWSCKLCREWVQETRRGLVDGINA